MSYSNHIQFAMIQENQTFNFLTLLYLRKLMLNLTRIFHPVIKERERGLEKALEIEAWWNFVSFLG